MCNPRVQNSTTMADDTSTIAKRRAAGIAWRNYAIVATFGALISYIYIFAVKPPAPLVCGTRGGPPVTSSRITLRDGRHLAYIERGLPKDEAKHKFIVIHGSGGSRLHSLPVSEEFLRKLSIYMVSYDRAGYGESDPNPKRGLKSEAYDVQDLADKLELGTKVYIAAISIGGYTAWSCLKYIPNRLAGVVMFSPATNFWWQGLPPKLAYEAFKTQAIGDKLALTVAHYTPCFIYLWMTQKWFPTSSTMGTLHVHSNPSDKEILMHFKPGMEGIQQGLYESMIRDKMVMFGNWEFDPTEIENPFPDGNGSVHIWHGDEDYLVPVSLQRYICSKLPWIKYHELKGMGHLYLVGDPRIVEQALSSLLGS